MLGTQIDKASLKRSYFVADKLSPKQLYGESLKIRQVPGFRLSERMYSPYLKTPKHSHEQALFSLVIQGAYTGTFGVKTCLCEPSTLLFHPAEGLHAEHFHNAGGRLFIIEIEPWWLNRVREQAAVIDSSTDFNGGDLALLGMKLYKEFLEIEDTVSPLVVEGLILAIIGEASRRVAMPVSAHPPRWLAQAKALLHDRFAEPLTLADIAQNVGVHPVHLAQVFHRYYNCTVGAYVRQLRLEFARQELARSDTPLCQIALSAGFSDQSHFTRTFKRYMGVPPAQYRKTARSA
jgi:AraC family transcriptional regulator